MRRKAATDSHSSALFAAANHWSMARSLQRRVTNLILVLAMALASVQFASHSVRPEVTDPDLVAYLANGGSLADLCLNGEGGSGHADCPFCREVDFFALAPRLPIIEPAPTTTDPFPERVTALLSPPLVLGVPPARAPPIA